MTKPSIKFSKFQRFDRTDDGEASILRGEKVIGQVTAEMANTGSFLNPNYTVVCYHVEIWDADCNVSTVATFRVSSERRVGIGRNYATAHKARSAALAWAKANG